VCIPFVYDFECVLDASGDEGQVFDPCELANVCDAGLMCLVPAAAAECDLDAGGCCLPFCDLGDANATCPGVGQSCVPFYEQGMAPPKYMQVGLCVVPE
jgi:hypothetical protein